MAYTGSGPLCEGFYDFIMVYAFKELTSAVSNHERADLVGKPRMHRCRADVCGRS